MSTKSIPQILFFLLFLLLWTSTFVAGSFLDSAIYAQSLGDSNLTFGKRSISFFYTLFTWTWSNILVLCCLSSLLGEYGRIAMGSPKKTNIMAALVRGFFIFLFLTAGQLLINGTLSMPQGTEIASGNLITSTEDYRRLSGVCSLFAFSVGFRPELFHDFLLRVTGGMGDAR